jgi:iron(III) transport system substrate-binding protein
MSQTHPGRPRSLQLAGVIFVALLVAACSSGASPTPTAAPSATPAPTASTAPSASTSAWDAVVAAAKQEGQVGLLTTEIPAWITYQQTAFQSATGVTLNLLARGANGVLETRLTSEVQANAVQTDVYEDVSRQFFYQHSDWFIDLSTAGLPNYANYPAGAKFNSVCVDDKWDVSGVTYNTNLVQGADIPKTWQDLVNPKWKGKVVLSDPSPGGFYLQWALIMRAAFGPSYLQAVAALDPSLQTSSVAAAQQVASGAKALSFLSQVDSGSDIKSKGAPIDFQLLPNPYVGSQACVGIPKSAPHPNAAKVLLNFLMSATSQGGACAAGVPNVSPINAPGCYQLPADFQMPQLNAQGIYPGMDNTTLQNQALTELGLK